MKVCAMLIGSLAIFCLLAFQSELRIGFHKPAHFPPPAYNFDRNPMDSVTIELGRLLFYDPVLSLNNRISCASCHSPYNAFAHTDHELSHGIDDQIGTRNAPALMNLAWQHSFMWDGAINHLDMQPLAPITHPKEMGERIEHVVQKLQAIPAYSQLFLLAFKDSIITGEHMLKALAQFQLNLISANSKYDLVKNGKADFTEQEKKGYKIYKQKCRSCHMEPLFSSFGFANNGLKPDSILQDYGKWNVTHLPSDSLLFKIPTLRNLSYSYPYMHDGRFKNLSQVLRHYNEGIMNSPTLSKELRSPLRLNAFEKADLIAFLLCLNDKEFIFNPKFQFPGNAYFLKSN